jgi:hypothetical protein
MNAVVIPAKIPGPVSIFSEDTIALVRLDFRERAVKPTSMNVPAIHVETVPHVSTRQAETDLAAPAYLDFPARYVRPTSMSVPARPVKMEPHVSIESMDSRAIAASVLRGWSVLSMRQVHAILRLAAMADPASLASILIPVSV